MECRSTGVQDVRPDLIFGFNSTLAGENLVTTMTTKVGLLHEISQAPEPDGQQFEIGGIAEKAEIDFDPLLRNSQPAARTRPANAHVGEIPCTMNDQPVFPSHHERNEVNLDIRRPPVALGVEESPSLDGRRADRPLPGKQKTEWGGGPLR